MSFFRWSSDRNLSAAIERGARQIEPLLPAALFIFMLTASQWWRIYQFGPDEGLNLMKGALLANGFPLYSEIWSDQPPVLTYILAAVHRVFPFDVDAARAVVLAFSGLLLWSLFRSIRRLEGRICAWFAVAVLTAIAGFQQLSVAVMVGLPAVALASAALDQTLAGASDNRNWRYWVAGGLFALALQTKLFVGVVLPALALAAFLGADGRLTTLRVGSARLARVALSTTAVFFTIATYVGEPLVAQLVMPHYRASFVSPDGGIAYFVALLTADIPAIVLLLFALGLAAIVMRGTNAARLVPVIWLVCAVSVLVQHRPLFEHHLFLIEPPIAWIAALAPNLVRDTIARRAVAAACILFLAVMGIRTAYAWGQQLSVSESRNAWRYPLFLKASPPDSWVVADTLMDAYRAGRLVPPELAVLSDKRKAARLLTSRVLISSIKKRKPAYLLLRRFDTQPALREYLDATYAEIPLVQPPKIVRRVRLYRRSIADPADAAGLPAAEALVTATKALMAFAPDGGFAERYEPGTARAWGRAAEPTEVGKVLLRPPVGSCFLRAHRITDTPLFWEAAKQSGRAVACAQGAHGGWAAVWHRAEICNRRADREEDDIIETLDDGISQSAVRFLIDLAAEQATKTDPPPPWLTDTMRRGLDFLLTAQNENGGWPQRFAKTGEEEEENEEEDYSSYATLNDGVTTETIATLLHAYRHTRDKRYLKAAGRGGNFLLKVQGPPSQPAWAQQYDVNNRPAAARAFELAAYGSEETGFAMNALLDLFAATKDRRFLKGLGAARDWLKRSTIRPGIWARLYELGTNRPIYGDRDGKIHYSLAEISAERRVGYRWEGEFPAVTRALGRYDALLEGGRPGMRRYTEEIERRARRKSHAEALPLGPAVVSGVRPGEGWSENGIVSTSIFVNNCRILLDALEVTTP